MYINDIMVNIHANIRLFADDTSLYMIVDNPNETARIVNADLEIINNCAKAWLGKLSPSKSESLLISRLVNRAVHPPLTMNSENIKEVEHHKHLGIYISHDGTWPEHISYITAKAGQRIYYYEKVKIFT